MRKTFSILICALNEEKNIGFLLKDIADQKYNKNLILDNIVIVSDGSTDRTNEIVRKFAENDKRISLEVNIKRLGKARSFNIGKKGIYSDFIVSLDADIRLENERTLESLFIVENYDKIGLIGGNPIPLECKKSFASLVCSFNYNIVNETKKQINKGNSFFSAHGRILALSRGLYEKIEIPDLPGDDQFMYFSCLKNGLYFVYKENARVLYKMPTSVKDHLRQSIRFRRAIDSMNKIFGEDIIKKETTIPIKIKIKLLIFVVFVHPIQFFSWAILYLLGKIKSVYFSQDEKDTSSWEISQTTK